MLVGPIRIFRKVSLMIRQKEFGTTPELTHVGFMFFQKVRISSMHLLYAFLCLQLLRVLSVFVHVLESPVNFHPSNPSCVV